jgi:hypothetical protein
VQDLQGADVKRERLDQFALKLGVRFFDYQITAFTAAGSQPGPAQRRCLFYKTGAGKTITALIDMSLWGHRESVVIAPPATFKQWEAAAAKVGITVHCMSHAMFRSPKTRLSRTMPVIADEMHLFGGHGGKGWRKLDLLAMHLQAPMILASATPNYNDAERVYCVKHILDPHGTKGGYLAFLYQECETEENPFGMMPKVTGFRHHPHAAAYLASLPGVDYLPDDLVYQIEDLPMDGLDSPAMDRFGLDVRNHRIIASLIEERHTRTIQSLVRQDGLLVDEAYQILTDVAGQATSPLLVFAVHSTVAQACSRSLTYHGVKHRLVTGATSTRDKAANISRFLDGALDVLVGTASLATGTDGLDQVCDTLVILDDTDDDALRRQLVGRIMPRGLATNSAAKQVLRVTLL